MHSARAALAERADPVKAIGKELISTGAWWAFVDEIASRHVGPDPAG